MKWLRPFEIGILSVWVFLIQLGFSSRPAPEGAGAEPPGASSFRLHSAPAPRTAEGIPAVDFLQSAPAARWSNGDEAIPFGGNDGDERGFVLYRAGAPGLLLETHPRWVDGGRIIGRYANITIPRGGAEFRADIGFLPRATYTDGVYFEVRAEFPGAENSVPLRRAFYKEYADARLSGFRQDLSRWRGRTGTILLSVDTGETSAQDWAVWARPRLVAATNTAPAGATTFVGGAVGTGRRGDHLLAPWGGKSNGLQGNLVLYLEFAGVDGETHVRVESLFEGVPAGPTRMDTLRKGQTRLWHDIGPRPRAGGWAERVFLNGKYAGDVRYTVRTKRDRP